MRPPLAMTYTMGVITGILFITTTLDLNSSATVLPRSGYEISGAVRLYFQFCLQFQIDQVNTFSKTSLTRLKCYSLGFQQC